MQEFSSKELNSIKHRLLNGESLRSISREYDGKIGRDALKSYILMNSTPEEKKEIESQLLSNKRTSATKPLDDKMKKIIIAILLGYSATDAQEKYGIDRGTLRRKMQEFVEKEPQLQKLYEIYKAKRKDYSNINFRWLFINMIRKNASQTSILKDMQIDEVSPRTVSRELEKLGRSNDKDDKELYIIAKRYSYENMRNNRELKYSGEHEKLFNRILEKYPAYNNSAPNNTNKSSGLDAR